jgi:uncharacterized membrane protein YwzB
MNLNSKTKKKKKKMQICITVILLTIVFQTKKQNCLIDACDDSAMIDVITLDNDNDIIKI